MIPKIIHYCWFGKGKIPDIDQMRIESWRRYCPDYEIRLWNEENYDISKCEYMLEAYEAGKWGFVPDYARLDIVCAHGGIYLDTDVELIKPLDNLLENRMFCGFEEDDCVNFGSGFGSVPGHPMLAEMMRRYENIHFRKPDGSFNLTPSPAYQTEVLVAHGLALNNRKQIIEDVTVYPKEYFCPKDYITGVLSITESTYSVHHFAMSWVGETERVENEIRQKLLSRGLNVSTAKLLSKVLSMAKTRNFSQAKGYIKRIIEK